MKGEKVYQGRKITRIEETILESNFKVGNMVF